MEEIDTLICPGCQHAWIHKGKGFYAQCPKCKKQWKKQMKNSKYKGELNRGSGSGSQSRDAST